MGKLTVHFVGICTHVRFVDTTIHDPSLPPHRVVLVVADQDVLIGRQVGKHTPELIRPDGIREDVKGLRVRVANAVEGRVLYDSSFTEPPDCVPSLRKWTPYLTDDDLAPEVVRSGEAAAAQFDIKSGSFRAGRDEKSKAICATVEIETHGPPELVCKPLPDGEEVPLLTFTEDKAAISFANKDVNQTRETQDDFLWHYKIFKAMPRNPGVPDPLNCQPRQPTELDVEVNGPGCSNSTWP